MITYDPDCHYLRGERRWNEHRLRRAMLNQYGMIWRSTAKLPCAESFSCLASKRWVTFCHALKGLRNDVLSKGYGDPAVNEDLKEVVQ